MKIFLVTIATFLSLTTSAYAKSGATTTAQKIDYARLQVAKLVSSGGYTLIPDSIDLQNSKRPESLVAPAFFALLGTEVEIQVCNFIVLKDGVRYEGWTYMFSNKLGVITRSTDNETSVILQAMDGSTSEIYLFKSIWESPKMGTVASSTPTLSELHLKRLK